MRRRAAQSSAEYMLILGAIFVIALIVIALLNFYNPAIADPRLSSSQSYWSSNAHPLQVRDFSLDSYRSPVQADANLTLVIKNPSTQEITLRNITLSPGSFRNVYYTNGSSAGLVDSLSIPFSPGEELTLIAQHHEAGSGAYLPPNVAEFSLGFKYNTALGPGYQNGSVPVVVVNRMH